MDTPEEEDNPGASRTSRASRNGDETGGTTKYVESYHGFELDLESTEVA